ncbi:MAG: hypothetical protein IT380_30575 [Myxococcales bacterium]|nr:hypothetical protein [Myxococcales bacterium]
MAARRPPRRSSRTEHRQQTKCGRESHPSERSARRARTSAAAAKVIGLEVCGVDLLESAAGPKVMELNSSPGIEGLEAATKKDIAGDIVRHALAYAAQRRG